MGQGKLEEFRAYQKALRLFDYCLGGRKSLAG